MPVPAVMPIAHDGGRLCVAVIPSIEMAAAGLDSIGAIVGYAVCSGISITSGSLVYSILSGPLQVLLRHLLCAMGMFLTSGLCLMPQHFIASCLHGTATCVTNVWLAACISSSKWARGVMPMETDYKFNFC